MFNYGDTDNEALDVERSNGRVAEWSIACDSSESLPEEQVSHLRMKAGVRIPSLSLFLPFDAL